MMNQTDLTNELRRLKNALPTAAGPGVEARLLAAFRKRRHPRLVRPWLYLAAAACLALLVVVVWRPATARRPDLTYRAPGFIELPYAESGVPLEQAVVVRVRLNSSQLTALGVPVSASVTAHVNADLLVGQDGVPRAVRLIR